MDGLPHDFALALAGAVQHPGPYALKSSISCVGTALHSGRKTRLALHPAAPGSGVVFQRTDLDGAGPTTVPARFDHVVDTRLCTVLGRADRPELRVGTVEHLMAALAGAGVSDVLVEVDGPELPILDGSAESFLFLIDCAGRIRLAETVPAIEVLRPVRVEQGEGAEMAWAELRPWTSGGTRLRGLSLSMSIAFAAPAIGRQALTIAFTGETFRRDLARARTFALADDIEGLRAAGLALGGSLDNAVVVDGGRVLNPGGLRMADECVRHKLLDVVGDLALAGAPIEGRFISHRSGHALNNRLLRALFADDANWRPAHGGFGLLRPSQAVRDERSPIEAAGEGAPELTRLAAD